MLRAVVCIEREGINKTSQHARIYIVMMAWPNNARLRLSLEGHGRVIVTKINCQFGQLVAREGGVLRECEFQRTNCLRRWILKT
jgi:hypothetical protein